MKLIATIAGLALLPFCAAATRTLLYVLSAAGPTAPPVMWIFAGAALWAVCFLLLPKPVRLYVLAHELSHAIWGALFSARVSGIRVSKSGGYARLSKTNFAIALAPYFFPLYTFAVILAYWLAAVWMDTRAFYPYWLALIGFTLGFHFSFTLDSLSRRQSDIEPYGRLFSYSLIYLVCVLQVAVLLVLVSRFVTLNELAARLLADIAWCLNLLKNGYK